MAFIMFLLWMFMLPYVQKTSTWHTLPSVRRITPFKENVPISTLSALIIYVINEKGKWVWSGNHTADLPDQEMENYFLKRQSQIKSSAFLVCWNV